MPRGIDEEISGRGDERISVVAQGLPLGQRNHAAIIVGAEAIHHHIVIALESAQVGHGDHDVPSPSVVRVDDVVEHLVVNATGLANVDGPTAIFSHDYGVVQQPIVARSHGPILLKDGDATSVVAIEQVVANDGIGDTVHVDGSTTASTIIIHEVRFHHSVRYDAVTAHAGVGVHVDAAGVVAVDTVAPNDGIVTAIADVDAVLLDRAIGLVVLDQQVVTEVGEEAPGSVVSEGATPHRDVGRVIYAHPRPIGMTDGEPLHHYVVGVSNEESISLPAASVYHHPLAMGTKGDGVGRSTGGVHGDTAIVGPGVDEHGVTRCDLSGGVLDRTPGMSRTTVAGEIGTIRGDIVRITLREDLGRVADDGG